VSIISLPLANSEDPSTAELAEIEREWPLIAAELELLDAEIVFINAGPAASELDRRRVRRAEHRLLNVSRRLAWLGGARAVPCGCPWGVVTSTLPRGGEMCGRCGSTWDRNDNIVTFYGLDGTDGAA
jgi:hypothetical protein